MPGPNQHLGAWGERRVARWYRERGWEVLATNWRCRDGELDLVLGRGGVGSRRDTVVFCEVKTRSSSAYGSPAEAVGRSKQARIRRLALQWLDESGVRAGELRFDVAGVLPSGVEVIEAAF